MISIELLSEVLHQDVKVAILKINTVYYQCGDGYDDLINIYELAHKCKEWTFKQGYELFSRILSNDSKPVGNCVVYRVEADPEESLKITNADSEPAAIFQACEWVLKEIK